MYLVQCFSLKWGLCLRCVMNFMPSVGNWYDQIRLKCVHLAGLISPASFALQQRNQTAFFFLHISLNICIKSTVWLVFKLFFVS